MSNELTNLEEEILQLENEQKVLKKKLSDSISMEQFHYKKSTALAQDIKTIEQKKYELTKRYNFADAEKNHRLKKLKL